MTTPKWEPESGLEGCLVFLLLLLSIVTSTVLEGLVLAKIWEWFAQDVYGLPGMSVAVAVGLSSAFGLLTPTYNLTRKSDLAPGGHPFNHVPNVYLAIGITFLVALVAVQFR